MLSIVYRHIEISREEIDDVLPAYVNVSAIIHGQNDLKLQVRTLLGFRTIQMQKEQLESFSNSARMSTVQNFAQHCKMFQRHQATSTSVLSIPTGTLERRGLSVVLKALSCTSSRW